MRQVPSPGKGFLIGALFPPLVVGLMYLSGVKYTEFTDSASSMTKGIVMPFLAASVVLVLLTSWLEWWGPVFREKVTAPRWLLAIPVLWVVAILVGINYDRVGQLSSSFLLWATIGTLLVGFSEEVTYRGLSIVALRGRMGEGRVWLFSTLMFSMAHASNLFLGQSFGATAVQLGYAFLLGSLLFVARRASGLLVVVVLLHAAWDWMLWTSESKALADPSDVLSGDPSGLQNPIALVMLFLFAVGARALFRNPGQARDDPSGSAAGRAG